MGWAYDLCGAAARWGGRLMRVDVRGLVLGDATGRSACCGRRRLGAAAGACGVGRFGVLGYWAGWLVGARVLLVRVRVPLVCGPVSGALWVALSC